MDISMPIMDGGLLEVSTYYWRTKLSSGIEATTMIRSMESNERISSGSPHRRAMIVAVSGLTSKQDKLRAFEAGIDE